MATTTDRTLRLFRALFRIEAEMERLDREIDGITDQDVWFTVNQRVGEIRSVLDDVLHDDK